MSAKIKPRKTPTYRLNKTTGRAVVTIDGKDIWLGKHGTPESVERYDRAVSEWLADGRRMPPQEHAADITITELVVGFWRHAESFYRNRAGSLSGEAENYKLAIRPLKALYGSTAAVEFGPKALRAVRQKMVEGGWCRKLINRQIGRVKHVFGWAVGEQLIPASVHEALLRVHGLRQGKTDARESDPVRPVTAADIEAVRPFLPPTIWAMIQLQLLTGMRPGELLVMRTCDIDRSGDVWVYKPSEHKTEHHGHTREVWIGPKARAILEPLLKLDLAAPIFCPKDANAWRHARARVHRRPNQKPNAKATDRVVRAAYDDDSYRRAIARVCDRADAWAKGGIVIGNDERLIPHWHPHQLRHNAGTEIRRQFGLEAARVILGHKSPAITAVYAEADREKARAIVGKVG